MQQLPALQVLPGEHLAALHPHDGLAVTAAVDLVELPLLLVLIHLAVHGRDHLLHQRQGLRQGSVVLLALCTGTGRERRGGSAQLL